MKLDVIAEFIIVVSIIKELAVVIVITKTV